LLLLEQGILNNRTGNVLAESGNRLCSEERIGDPTADRKLSPGVDMEARQERSGAAGVNHLTRGRPQMRGSCVVIAIPPAHRPEGRGAVMTEASQDTRMSDRKRGAYANRSPLSAHRPKSSSCQEHRVCDAEWQVRCHEGQREEYPVNACHVHYSFIYSGGCSGQSGCHDDTTACGSARMCAAATPP
jgi:hypothetical protein